MPDLDSESDGEDQATEVPGLGGLNPARLILIVVGAHLRAEVGDRPIAYSMRDRMQHRLAARAGGESPARDVVVCTDVWYLNNEHLRACPTVSIGGPGVNALAAFLADKLPHALVVDSRYVVQLDVEFGEVLASVWGMDHALTVTAAEAFSERYLDGFLGAACRGAGM